MPHLRLVSVLAVVVSMIVVTLVNFAINGHLGVFDLITAVLVGLSTGIGTYLAFRHQPANGCRK